MQQLYGVCAERPLELKSAMSWQKSHGCHSTPIEVEQTPTDNAPCCTACFSSKNRTGSNYQPPIYPLGQMILLIISPTIICLLSCLRSIQKQSGKDSHPITGDPNHHFNVTKLKALLQGYFTMVLLHPHIDTTTVC